MQASPKDPGELAQPVGVAPVAKRPRGLSLRVTLGLMALIAIGLATWANQLRQMREATAMIRRHHGMYYFDFEYIDSTYALNPQSWAPRWLRKLVGDENLHEVTWVYINDRNFNDADLAFLIKRFPKIRDLGIEGAAITDRGLTCLRGNQFLEGLFLKDREISDAGMDLLDIATMPQVSLIDVRGTKVSDAKAGELEKYLTTREAALKRANPGKRVDLHGVLKGGGGFDPVPKSSDARADYERGLETKAAKATLPVSSK